jgi:hypothetical protein
MPADIGRRTSFSVVMASGGVTTGSIDLVGYNAGAFQTPATFEETTVKYQGGQGDGDTFVDIYDSTSALISSATVSTSRMVQLPAACFAFRKIKIVGTVGGNVGADRTLVIHLAGN